MLLNCGVGEDSWESLGLQGDPTSPFWRSALGVHWKDWWWSWNSSTLATWCEELTHLKDPDAGKDWGQEEKGTTDDEMAGWHHWLDGRESEWTPGVGDGQGGLGSAIHGVAKSRTWLSDWTELNDTVKRNFLNMLSPKEIFSQPLISLQKGLHIREKYMFRTVNYTIKLKRIRVK